jgi:hypothetical protein
MKLYMNVWKNASALTCNGIVGYRVVGCDDRRDRSGSGLYAKTGNRCW